ncbi:DUF5681 domain-containing protein [Magnetofaba australis]|uniref:DUF5681 domain-containing protein n=1 Tax=Magnetofaba australis TaxID=1472297 RepID=UPI0011807203|nr:DUF5681 domain-containing protein [Magnetofaba australis]
MSGSEMNPNLSGEESERDHKGRFRPGNNANPAGRPKGSGFAGEMRRRIQDAAPGVVAALIAKAEDGDIQAARLLLERCVPSLKAESPAVSLSGFDGDLTQRGEALISALRGVQSLPMRRRRSWRCWPNRRGWWRSPSLSSVLQCLRRANEQAI